MSESRTFVVIRRKPQKKGQPAAEDPVLIENLITANAKANARSQEREQLVQNQEAQLRFLARAVQYLSQKLITSFLVRS